MRRLYVFIVEIVFCIASVSGQVCDTTCTTTESRTTTNITYAARNSITLGPNFSYTPTLNLGSLSLSIVNPLVTGTVGYNSTAINPETRTLNTTSGYYVGATNGSLNISPSGSAGYTIPLDLLPGVNGLSPSLSIVYSSSAGPGMVGYGWNLAGLSVISRGPNTFYNDNLCQGIQMDGTDKFYLDGQRLINTSYTYGAPDALYQTESDIFTRISAKGGAPNWERWFQAETKSGLVCEYGKTIGSKQTINSIFIKWYISKVSDLFGNSMNISYLQDNNCVYPAEITYGPNTITFYYKAKSEKDATYLKGMKIEQWYVLDKITVKYNSVIVKTYEFKYNYQSTLYNGYSMLNEIIEYGTGTPRFNSTAITYQTPATVNFTQTTYNTSHEYINYKSKLCTGDFNGDGKTDFFCLPDASKGATWTGNRVYFGDGNDNFPTSYANSTPNLNLTYLMDIRSLDVNGDGKDDILYEYVESGVSYFRCMLSNGGSFSPPILITTISGNGPQTGISGKIFRSLYLMENDNEFAGADYNGDGINDIFINDSYGNWVIKSFGDGYGGVSSSLTELGSDNIACLGGPIVSADFNGDGKTEIWFICSTGDMLIHAFNGIDLGPGLIPSFPLPYAFLFGDFNADGKSDLFLYGLISGGTVVDMYSWQIWLSTGGANFEKYTIPQKKANLKDDYLRLGDFNGDGATDIMVTAKNNSWTGSRYYISKNRGTDFYVHSLSTYPVASHNYYLSDYNGDGHTDFICTDGQSPWWTGYQVYKTKGNTSFLANKIGDGLGKIVKLAYIKLSQAPTSIYQKGTGATFPVYDFNGPLTVVDTVLYDNGLGTLNTQTYYYEGAKLHLQGKGFLGFSKIKKTDVVLGIENQEIYSFNPTYYYPQLVKTFTKRSGLNDTINKVINTWSQIVLDVPKKRIFPYVQNSIHFNKLTGQTVSISTNYDNYGNPSLITKNYIGAHTEITTITNNNVVNTSQWLLGRPDPIITQYNGYDTTFTRTINRTYSATSNNLAIEKVYPGTAFELVHKYRYYNNGTLMRDSIVVGSVWRTNVYKYQSNGIRIEKITDPLSHSKVFNYYPNGRLASEKDYMNNVVTYRYDSLGRQLIRLTSFGDQLTTVYAWESVTGSPRYSVQVSGNDLSLSKKYYDKLGREVKTDIKGFDGSLISTHTEYNVKGQLYRISEPASTSAWNVHTYNNYGQLTGITRPSGRNSAWTYTGPTVTETVAGKPYSKTYNSAGLLTTASDNGGSITYAYLPNGKVKSITAPGGIITRMKYDVADNQIKLIDPSAGTIVYTYNAFGELLSQTSARNQLTSIIYLNDGRIYRKSSPDVVANYGYNSNKQLKRIKLSTGVNRIFRYDTKGRLITSCDSIGSVIDSTTYLYDNLGRLQTITHPSGIRETRNYKNGYPEYVNAGDVTRWKVTGMTSRLQVSTAQYGSNVNMTCLYDNYGFPKKTSVVYGSTTLQDYRYGFNPVDGNLSWRKDSLPSRNLKEEFFYDQIDRLDYIRKAGITTLDMAYDGNKGGISSKSDVGTLKYELQGKPYQLSSIDPSTSLITSSMNNSINYTSFEKVLDITEGINRAEFTYNCDAQRAKMIVKQNGTPFLTRWYMGNSYMKEDAGGVVKEYTYIGGDAYSAPVLAITQGGSTTYYYLLRDYLGSILRVITTTGSVVGDYSYDAWGRTRDPNTWAYSPSTEPTLFSGRGFTGHEHLPWFKLINMNGRAYDPLTGQFLSVDPFVQSPDFTQSFNRFGYCFNNPLKYTDPSGMLSDENYRWFGDDGGGSGGGGGGVDLDLQGQPIYDIGVGSGSGYWDNTPHIASWKMNEYYLDETTGSWVNIFGQKLAPSPFNIYRFWTEVYFNSKSISYDMSWFENGSFVVWMQNGEFVTRGRMDVISSKAAAAGGSGPRKAGGNAFSWSATIAIGPVGFTLEAGVVTDNNNGANTFFSAGFAAGYEASFQFNYYWIFGPFSTSDWAGVSYNADIGKGRIAGGGGANAGHLTDTEYFPVSYTTAKAAYGPAFGLGSGNRSVTVLGNINVVDIIPFYPPTPW